MPKKTFNTIKDAAEALLLQESYTDVYGRKVGLTYKAILTKLHKDFPRGRTSLKSLREIAYSLNASKCRMPVRRRSPKVLARDYARALLIAPEGYSMRTISKKVLAKFPEHPYIAARQLASLAIYLSHRFKLPPRPEAD